MGPQGNSSPLYQTQYMDQQPVPSAPSRSGFTDAAHWGGAALNLAGLLSGKGAIGSPLIEQGSLYQQQADLDQYRQYQREQATAQVKRADQSSGRVQEFIDAAKGNLNPAEYDVISGLLKQGEWEKGLQLYNQSEYAKQQKNSMLQTYLTGVRTDINESQQQARNLEDEVKTLPRSLRIAEAVKQLSPEAFADDEQLGTALQRQFGQLSKEERTAYINQAREAAKTVTGWKEYLPVPDSWIGQGYDPKQAAAKFENLAGPEARDIFQALRGQQEVYRQSAKAGIQKHQELIGEVEKSLPGRYRKSGSGGPPPKEAPRAPAGEDKKQAAPPAKPAPLSPAEKKRLDELRAKYK